MRHPRQARQAAPLPLADPVAPPAGAASSAPTPPVNWGRGDRPCLLCRCVAVSGHVAQFDRVINGAVAALVNLYLHRRAVALPLAVIHIGDVRRLQGDAVVAEGFLALVV